MHEKLPPEKLAQILEAGICEFAEQGMEKAKMGAIAQRAGISVGVLYKYYADKESFFLACVRRSIGRLEEALKGVMNQETDFSGYALRLIRTLQNHAAAHGEDIRMYQEITSGRNRDYTAVLAGEIEAMTAQLYTELLQKAQREGRIRSDADPALYAFFFDNLLMMLQFSYCCDYYRERWNYYCPAGDALQDDRVADQLLNFLTEGIFSGREKRGKKE